MNTDAIPLELRERPQWVLWRTEQRDGKPTKAPYRADGSGRASSTDPRSWSTFEAAVAAASKADGIGYVFSPDDPYVGIDLDGGLNEADRVAIVLALDSYAETSVSGNGMHVILRANLNGHGRHPVGFGVFDRSRFFVVTGQHVAGTPSMIEERQAELDEVLAEYLPAEEPTRAPLPAQPVDLDDRELLERAFAARNGSDFQALWEGRWQGTYPSRSEADLAFANMLAFWAGRDADRMDRLFRASGLYREKWERADYRESTIERAISGTGEVYSPSRNVRGGWGRDDPSRADADLIAYPFTDLGNARRFVAMHRGAFLYAREERVWLEWRDGRWRRDVTGAVERAAKTVVEKFWEQVAELPDDKREKAARWAIASQNAGRLRAMIELASTELDFVVRLEQLDSDPWLLSCGNGTLDLRTGALRAPDPADLISRGTDVNYVPDAPRTRWDQFLDEVFDGDAELVAFVRRAYGSCLTGDTRDRLLLIQYGSRLNGKSTLNRVFAQMLGADLAQAAPIRLVMRGRQSEIPNEVARLHRARFVVIAETADGRKLNENQVKALTGRDRIPARFLHQEWFEFLPEFKLVLYTNFKPQIDGSDGAVWDRVRLIPFNVSFAESEDKELDVKLTAELEGILAWAVEGCLEWLSGGLGTCDAVERATQAYRRENDVLGTFLDTCCEFDREHVVSRADLRAACETFFQEADFEPPSAAMIGRALAARGIDSERGRKAKLYHGVRLLDVEVT